MQTMPSELEFLRKENEELVGTYGGLALEYKRLKSRNEKAQDRIRKLEETKLTLYHDLQVCKDDLFRLQPIADVADTEILRQFENVCERISSWIDEEISLFEREPRSLNAESQMFIFEESPELEDMLQRNSQAGEYLVGAFVHEQLIENVLGDHIFLFGLCSDTAYLLRAAEENMKSLDPPRGKSSCVFANVDRRLKSSP